MTDQRIKHALLLYGLDDMLQLWWIAGTVHDFTGIPRDTPDIVAPTLDVIYELLDEGYVFVGDAVQDEKGLARVERWNIPPATAISRIQKRWSELEAPLNLGDVVWMKLTDKGIQKARELDDEGCDPWEDSSQGK